MDEDELTKKNYFRIAENSIALNCEWRSCSGQNMKIKKFLLHVSEHVAFVDEYLTDNKYICQWRECQFSTESRTEIDRHIYFHAYHAKIKFCGAIVLEKNDLQCTLNENCRNMIPDCFEISEASVCLWDDCFTTFMSAQDFYWHVKSHAVSFDEKDSKNTLICQWQGCNLNFKNESRLSQHLRSHTKEKSSACPSCGAVFSANHALKEHCHRNADDKACKFECPYCKSKFSTESLLKEHVRRHINNVKCPHCEMTCTTQGTLKTHIKYRHTSEKPFKCPECDAKFKFESDLSRHDATCHSADEKLDCYYCDRKYRTVPHLLQHVKRQHIDNPSKRVYLCHMENCQKSFTRGRNLTKHLKRDHSYCWPDGHTRFRYIRDEFGCYKLQTTRLETIELSKEIMNDGDSDDLYIDEPEEQNIQGEAQEQCTERITVEQISDQVNSEQNVHVIEREQNDDIVENEGIVAQGMGSEQYVARAVENEQNVARAVENEQNVAHGIGSEQYVAHGIENEQNFKRECNEPVKLHNYSVKNHVKNKDSNFDQNIEASRNEKSRRMKVEKSEIMKNGKKKKSYIRTEETVDGTMIWITENTGETSASVREENRDNLYSETPDLNSKIPGLKSGILDSSCKIPQLKGSSNEIDSQSNERTNVVTINSSNTSHMEMSNSMEMRMQSLRQIRIGRSEAAEMSSQNTSESKITNSKKNSEFSQSSKLASDILSLNNAAATYDAGNSTPTGDILSLKNVANYEADSNLGNILDLENLSKELFENSIVQNSKRKQVPQILSCRKKPIRKVSPKKKRTPKKCQAVKLKSPLKIKPTFSIHNEESSDCTVRRKSKRRRKL